MSQKNVPADKFPKHEKKVRIRKVVTKIFKQKKVCYRGNRKLKIYSYKENKDPLRTKLKINMTKTPFIKILKPIHVTPLKFKRKGLTVTPPPYLKNNIEERDQNFSEDLT